MRGVDDNSQPKRKRSKIQVEPGKSISVEDLNILKPCTSSQALMIPQDDITVNNVVIDPDSDLEDQAMQSSSDEDDGLSSKIASEKSVEILMDAYYVVELFAEDNKKRGHYIGRLVHGGKTDVVSESEEVNISFLKSSRWVKNGFVFPDIPDLWPIPISQLVCKFDEPDTDRRGTLIFSEIENFHIL